MRSIPRRARIALAGTLGGLALAAAAGTAYAVAGTAPTGTEPVETGYAVEVAADAADCPESTGTLIEGGDR